MFHAFATAASTTWMYFGMLIGLATMMVAVELVTKPRSLEYAANLIGGRVGDALRSFQMPTPFYVAYRLGLLTTVPRMADRAKASAGRATVAARAHVVKIAEPASQPQLNV
jgi:hypothetical protein